ncbi:DUF308 domain-containing protein [Caldibacillus debilis]|nr:DUF308 domain-containing protein [Caldibacillus debilis]
MEDQNPATRGRNAKPPDFNYDTDDFTEKMYDDPGHPAASYNAESAAEFAPEVRKDRTNRYRDESEGNGPWFGYLAIALAILSLFVMPVFLGAVAIILGVVSRNREARTLGNWAIGIGILSVIIGLFIAPFY